MRSGEFYVEFIVIEKEIKILYDFYIFIKGVFKEFRY